MNKPEPTDKAVAKQSLSVDAYVGPLPPAEAFQAYDNVVPGAAERTLQMAEREQAHRLDTETRLTNAIIEDNLAERKQVCRAQWLAWTLALGIASMGGFLIYPGYQVAGSFVAGTTIVGVITAFLGQSRKSQDSKEKAGLPDLQRSQ